MGFLSTPRVLERKPVVRRLRSHRGLQSVSAPPQPRRLVVPPVRIEVRSGLPSRKDYRIDDAADLVIVQALTRRFARANPGLRTREVLVSKCARCALLGWDCLGIRHLGEPVANCHDNVTIAVSHGLGELGAKLLNQVRRVGDVHGVRMALSDDARRGGEILDDRLAPLINRPRDELRERLAFGSADLVAERVSPFREAGVQWMFLWPVTDEIEQLQLFGQQVKPQLDA